VYTDQGKGLAILQPEQCGPISLLDSVTTLKDYSALSVFAHLSCNQLIDLGKNSTAMKPIPKSYFAPSICNNMADARICETLVLPQIMYGNR